MQLGMIGLGKMGANMTRRLLAGGHALVVYDLSPDRVADLRTRGAIGSASIEALVAALRPPRCVWLMLPAGPPTDAAVETVGARLEPGDILIDGGNSHFKDDIVRAARLREKGVHYVDVGTSGGVWGLERGYSLMIGGPPEAVERLDPIFRALSPGAGAAGLDSGDPAGTARLGYLHCGGAGAGHFVKMVHNGIEYGMMQAYAEGFDVLARASAADLPDAARYQFPLGEIAEVWRHGSVIQSWLLDLAAMALADDPRLTAFEGAVADSGEGRWMVDRAVEQATPVHVLAAALFARFRSRQDHTFGERLLSAMRFKFGGHVERPPDA